MPRFCAQLLVLWLRVTRCCALGSSVSVMAACLVLLVPAAEFHVPVVVVTAASEEDVVREVAAEAARPFDLEADPLVRARLTGEECAFHWRRACSDHAPRCW